MAQALSTRVDILDANYLTQIELLQVSSLSVDVWCAHSGVTAHSGATASVSVRMTLQMHAAKIQPEGSVLSCCALRLQDRVPPFPTEDALEVMQQAWGRPVDAVLSKISEEPVAAASLGQVGCQDALLTLAPTQSSSRAAVQRQLPHRAQEHHS